MLFSETHSAFVRRVKKIEMSISVGDVNDIAAAAADDTYCGFHKLLNAEKEEIANTDINQMFAKKQTLFSTCLPNKVDRRRRGEKKICSNTPNFMLVSNQWWYDKVLFILPFSAAFFVIGGGYFSSKFPMFIFIHTVFRCHFCHLSSWWLLIFFAMIIFFQVGRLSQIYRLKLSKQNNHKPHCLI